VHMVKSATNRANEQAVQTARPGGKNATAARGAGAGGMDGFGDESVCTFFFFFCYSGEYHGGEESVKQWTIDNDDCATHPSFLWTAAATSMATKSIVKPMTWQKHDRRILEHKGSTKNIRPARVDFFSCSISILTHAIGYWTRSHLFLCACKLTTARKIHGGNDSSHAGFCFYRRHYISIQKSKQTDLF
jgi:hypothetical protein